MVIEALGEVSNLDHIVGVIVRRALSSLQKLHECWYYEISVTPIALGCLSLTTSLSIHDRWNSWKTARLPGTNDVVSVRRAGTNARHPERVGGLCRELGDAYRLQLQSGFYSAHCDIPGSRTHAGLVHEPKLGGGSAGWLGARFVPAGGNQQQSSNRRVPDDA